MFVCLSCKSNARNGARTDAQSGAQNVARAWVRMLVLWFATQNGRSSPPLFGYYCMYSSTHVHSSFFRVVCTMRSFSPVWNVYLEVQVYFSISQLFFFFFKHEHANDRFIDTIFFYCFEFWSMILSTAFTYDPLGPLHPGASAPFFRWLRGWSKAGWSMLARSW